LRTLSAQVMSSFLSRQWWEQVRTRWSASSRVSSFMWGVVTDEGDVEAGPKLSCRLADEDDDVELTGKIQMLIN
jgi:hypothetical protein